jgi:hypothetical protein
MLLEVLTVHLRACVTSLEYTLFMLRGKYGSAVTEAGFCSIIPPRSCSQGSNTRVILRGVAWIAPFSVI